MIKISEFGVLCGLGLNMLAIGVITAIGVFAYGLA